MTPAIDYRYVRFPIGGALDTKTDPAVVDRPSLVVAQNCWMDRSGSLSKRYGYVVLSATTDVLGVTVPSLEALVPFADTFIGLTPDYAYLYLPSASRYTPLGVGVSAKLSVTDLSAVSSADARMVDHATVGNYTLHAIWEGASTLRWVLRDDVADTIVASEDQASSAFPRVVARGSRILMFYASTAATQLRVRIFDLTSTATMVTSLSAASVLVASNMDTGQPVDAVDNSTYGIFVVYKSTTANTLNIGFVSSTGVLAATSTIATTADSSCIAGAVAPNLTTHGVVYSRQTQPNDIYAVLLSWNGSAWSTLSTSGAIDSAMVLGTTSTACAFESNSTTLTIWYCDEPAGLQLHQGSYTTAGVATARAFTVYRSRLAAKPFRYGGVWYAMVYVVGGADELQASLYVVSIDGVVLTGRPLSTSPVAVISDSVFLYAANRGNFFGQVTNMPGVSDAFRVGFLPRLTPGNVATSLASLRRSAAASAVLDLTPGDNWKAVQIGDSVYIGGAMLLQYDGGPNGMVEAGFLRLVDPAEITATPAGSGALTASSSYSYHVVPEYLDSHGVREQGTNFGPKVVSLGVGEDEVTLVIPTIAASLKADLISFAIYRTEANGTVFYRVGSVANSSTATTVSFNDRMSDADIVINESFPYADGLLLDNTPPPPGHVIAGANGRLFIASPSVRGLIHASKLRAPGEPIEFNDALTIQIPDDGSDVTAMAALKGALVVFTRRRIYVVAGEGPNNIGEGQWLTPEQLTVDTGCLSQRSVVETPLGVMFRGAKGFYLLDESFRLQYIGAPLENSFSEPLGDHPSGLLIPDKQQVRWSDGDATAVYDYFHNQWVRWTFAWTGPSVMIDGDQYAPLGSVYKETAGTYADAGVAFEMKAKLAPFKDPGGLNGQMRAKSVGVVGEAAGSFTLTVTAEHDFSGSTAQTLTWAVTAGQFFKKNRLMTRILAGLSLTVSDGGVAGAGMRLQEVAVEIGQRIAGKTMKR